MAIIPGTRSDGLLSGVVAAVARAVPTVPARAPRRGYVLSGWITERGTPLMSMTATINGGYPGSIRSMNALQRQQLLVTPRYLVVGEGTTEGFALPMADVLAAQVTQMPSSKRQGLIVWYSDGLEVTSFSVSFQSGGKSAAENVLDALVRNGVRELDTPIEKPEALAHLTWDEARAFADETVVWSGPAMGNVGGWNGSAREGVHLWLTESSVMWCGERDSGLYRIPLERLLLVRTGHLDHLTIGIEDHQGARYDLAFDVGQAEDIRPAMRLSEAFASLGVDVDQASAALAPWRAGGMIRPTDRGR